jgi:hypothetical protein
MAEHDARVPLALDPSAAARRDPAALGIAARRRAASASARGLVRGHKDASRALPDQLGNPPRGGYHRPSGREGFGGSGLLQARSPVRATSRSAAA